jgi:NAD(P)-dependent dehydrogenase (short-subunit alcohol dehydrogenase family)
MKIALVTGVGRAEGLGFEVCRQLAANGFTVLLTARNLQSAEALAAALQSEGASVQSFALDISDAANVDALAASVRQGFGRLDVLVNNAAGVGAFGDPAFGLLAGGPMGVSYAVAKAALNALTVKLAKEETEPTVRINAVCPGFTATFPGGEAMGARPVAEGAAGIVWAALLPNDGPTGGFFRDGIALPW